MPDRTTTSSGDAHGRIEEERATERLLFDPSPFSFAFKSSLDEPAKTTLKWKAPSGEEAPEVNDGFDNQCPGDLGYGAIGEISADCGFHDALARNRYSCDPPQQGATLYEIVRSERPSFPPGCVAVVVSQPSWVDCAPPPGTVYIHLARPLQPFAGSWGVDFAGDEREVSC